MAVVARAMCMCVFVHFSVAFYLSRICLFVLKYLKWRMSSHYISTISARFLIRDRKLLSSAKLQWIDLSTDRDWTLCFLIGIGANYENNIFTFSKIYTVKTAHSTQSEMRSICLCVYVWSAFFKFFSHVFFHRFQSANRISNCNEPAHWKSIASNWRNNTPLSSFSFSLISYRFRSYSTRETKCAAESRKCNASRLWLDKPAIWIIFLAPSHSLFVVEIKWDAMPIDRVAIAFDFIWLFIEKRSDCVCDSKVQLMNVLTFKQKLFFLYPLSFIHCDVFGSIHFFTHSLTRASLSLYRPPPYSLALCHYLLYFVEYYRCCFLHLKEHRLSCFFRLS